MLISGPKFVVLDTASINFAASRRNDPETKELLRIFTSGEWVPYITHDHLEEVCSHESESEFSRRIDLLSSLKHIGYLDRPNIEKVAGSSIDLWELEIAFLIENPNSNWRETVAELGPKVRSGFISGSQFVKENVKLLAAFRLFRKESKEQKVEAVNLTHFNVVDSKKKLPQKGNGANACSKTEAIHRLIQFAKKLGIQISKHGDKRQKNSEESAFRGCSESLRNRFTARHLGRYKWGEAKCGLR